MLKIISLVSEIRSILIDNDYYFVDNIGMDAIGNHPYFQAQHEKSSGCISYSNSENTYWSPSVVALVYGRNQLASILFNVDHLIRDINVKLKKNNATFNSFYPVFRNNAFGGIHPEPEIQIKDLVITHYDDFETDGKLSSNHPYIINFFDFFAIEGRNEESLSNAYVLKKIFGHFDLLSFLFAGEKPMFQELVAFYKDNTKDYVSDRLLELNLSTIEKELEDLRAIISEFYELHNNTKK